MSPKLSGRKKAELRSVRIELRKWYTDIKKQHECIECGEDDYRVLEFHHDEERREGRSTPSQILYETLDKRAVLKEIAKCNCLCANCHKILHWEEDHKKE